MKQDLDAIYAAITDDRAYAGLAEVVANSCGSRSAVIVELAASGEVEGFHYAYWSDSVITDYLANHVHADPWTETAIGVGRFGEAAALDEAMTPRAFRGTAIRNELFRAHGDDTGRCMGVMPRLGRRGIMMAVHRAERAAAFSRSDELQMDSIYSHVSRAVAARRLLEQAHARCLNLADLVEATGKALVQLDRDLGVVAASSAALALIARLEGPTLRGGKLVLPPPLDARLRAAVAATIDRQPGGPSAFLIPRPEGRLAVRALVHPAGLDAASGAVLELNDPEDDAIGARRERALREAYGLTPRELDLAVGLASGRTLEEIATLRGVTRETLRTQLRALFARTGVNRQSDLVRLLATFPVPRAL